MLTDTDKKELRDMHSGEGDYCSICEEPEGPCLITQLLDEVDKAGEDAIGAWGYELEQKLAGIRMAAQGVIAAVDRDLAEYAV